MSCIPATFLEMDAAVPLWCILSGSPCCLWGEKFPRSHLSSIKHCKP